MPGYRPIPGRFEVGAVLQHRPRSLGDADAPPKLLIVGRDEELGRWLAVDPQFQVASVWDSTARLSYERVAPGGFKARATHLSEGKRIWARLLAGRKVSARTG